ncbi:MAG TPA: ABC-F family ATP-binding cassette domain-containing protein [Longimicrobiaceae bacterium]|nr:ABC-F family ATP-binding cassette domain-containing protein [Longimicrobiaceae bacterium]
MPLLDVQDLRKSFGTRTLFDGVSFAVDEGEKVGFIGANGSGKSTLFRVVAGLEGMETGTLALRRDATVGYLAQEPEFEPGQSIRAAVAKGHPEMEEALTEYDRVARQIAEGSNDTERLLARQGELMHRIDALGGWDWQHRVATILTRVGLDAWERPVDGLSGGERKRVALAQVLLQRPDLLLLDEPTNHLDADTTLWLEEYLQEYPGAVMLITHDRYFLDRVVTRMIEVHRSELTPFPGGYTEYLEAKAERQARLSVEEEKRARLIEQELAWARRSPSARTGKQKARLQRLDATRHEQRERRLPEVEVAEMKFGQPPRLGRTVLDLHGVSKAFDERVLVRGLTTRLSAGERIGIVGPNGAGKTTLLRMILGQEAPDAGAVEWGKNTRIAYFDQKREDLDPDATLLQAISNEDWVHVAGNRVHVRSYLESFLFHTSVHDQKVRSLSGGERNRLLLARLLLEEANLLILDEPTNDLDLVTLQVLENALADFPGCVLVVTHDRYFLDKVATGLLVFEGDGLVRRHEGGYDLYQRLRAEREAAEAESARAAAPAKKAGAPAQPARKEGPRKLSYREKQELEGMETAILEAEAERESLGAQLADPALYTDAPGRVAGLTAAFQRAGERVEALYARWAELEEVATR